MSKNVTQETRTQELIITRGLPASGKTTWAKQWVAGDALHRLRINRDDLRFMLFGAYVLDNTQENALTKVQQGAVREALKAHKSVVVDDTHLRQKYIAEWIKVAREFAGNVQVRFQDFSVDVQECIRRDAERGALGSRLVGADVIASMSKRYLRNGSVLPVLPAEFYERIQASSVDAYVEDQSLPTAWMFDIDGTIARMSGRSPYEWNRVDEDEPIQEVIDLAQTLHKAGHVIIVMSGRDGSCEEITRLWLDVAGMPYDHLFMRTAGNMDKDSLVKERLFDANIRGRFLIKGVVDDRLQVCRKWYSMGLPLFRVGDPDASF